MLNNTAKRAVQYVLLIVSLLVTIFTVRNTIKILGRGDAIKDAEQRIVRLKEEQARLLQLKEKVDSKEFIEKEAREKLGLAKEGEVVVVLPKEDILKRLAPKDEEEEIIETLPIWKRWTRVFF